MVIEINMVVSYRISQYDFTLDKTCDKLLKKRHTGAGIAGDCRDLSYWFKDIKSLNNALKIIYKDKRFKVECCSLEGWHKSPKRPAKKKVAKKKV